jgi:AcrR family transcriptional regulator
MAMKNGATNEPSKKLRILQAAEIIFSRKGYVQATLDEIIELADTGKGTVYKYFGNKDNLFYTLVQQKHQDLMVRFCQVASSSAGTEEKIKAYLDIWVKFLVDNNVLWQVLMFEMTGGNRGLCAMRNAAGELELRAKWGSQPEEKELAAIRRYIALLEEEVKPFEEIFLEGSHQNFFREGIKPVNVSQSILFSVSMVVFRHEVLHDGMEPGWPEQFVQTFVRDFLYGMAEK